MVVMTGRMPVTMRQITEADFGPYLVLNTLRQDGAMTVKLAAEMGTGQYVAVTQLPGDLVRDEGFLQRFDSRVGAALDLHHPNVLPVLDHGIANGVPYVAHRYVPAGTLAGRINISGHLPFAETARYIVQLASALDEAHYAGAVHFGLNAGSVMRGDNDNLLISDFGTAQLSLDMMGASPAMLPYTAPEVFLRVPCTYAVDIYSLGVLAYHMLTGAVPFTSASYTQWMTVHLNRPVPSSQEKRPDTPRGVHPVLEKAMAKLPHLRYGSAGEFARDFVAALLGAAAASEVTVRPTPVQTLGAAFGGPAPGSMLGQTRKLSVGRRESPSRLYADALMIEQEDPAKALSLYHRLIELQPQLAQGEVIERLSRLETELGLGSVDDLFREVERLAAEGDWGGVEMVTTRILSYKPGHEVARNYRREARYHTVSAAHYQFATAASLTGEWPAVITLLSELYEARPGYPDYEQLLTINRHTAPYVRSVRSIRAHDAQILSLGWSPDSTRIVSGGTDRYARIWSLRDGELLNAIEERFSWVCFSDYSPQGKMLFTASWDGEIRLWEMPSGRYIGVIAGLANQLRDLAFAHHDPNLMATAAGYFLTLWQMPGGKRVAVIREYDREPVISMAFSPRHPILVTGINNGSLRVRDMESADYDTILDVPVHRGPIYTVVFSQDGRRVATGSRDGTARVTDITNGDVLTEMPVGHGPVRGVAFSMDGSVVATGGRDGIIRLWDSETGLILNQLEGHSAPVRRVTFAPDGRTLASAGTDGTIGVWRLLDQTTVQVSSENHL